MNSNTCRALGLALVSAIPAAPALGDIEFLDETFAFDRDRPAAGEWLGNLVPGGAIPDTWASLTVAEDDAGAWTIRMTAMTVGALNTACAEVAVDGSSVEFVLPAVSAHFSGRISEDGQRFTGTIVSGPDNATEGSFELARTPRATDLPEPLAFSGELASSFGKMAMTLVFAETPGGNWVGVIDVPAQGLTGMPLSPVRREGDTIAASLGVPGAPAQIDVTIVDDGQRLTGTFQQGPFTLDVDFPRETDYEVPTINRPQHPEPPYPYAVRDVTVPHPDGHTLAGTLTVPEGTGPFPAAVLISGSGPQDRDETIFNHKPFLVIADYLTRHGIAVLRYDDRGAGESGGVFDGATSEDLATDTLAVMQYLATVDGIDPGRVGLVGHSEGGLIAPMVAGLTDDVDFMVLLAGPGVPGDELLLVQAELVARAAGANAMMIASTRMQQKRVFELVRGGAEEEQLRNELRAMIKAQLELAGLEGDMLEDALSAQMRQVASPWMRYFITYDPRPALARVRCPVLALNGMLDLQVYHDQNLPEIEKAIASAGGDVTVRAYEGLNHLFQPSETGAISEYGMIETTFDETVLRDIVAWIREKTGR